jgi:hypothetical protein
MSFYRKRHSVSKSNPISVSSNRSDTEGMDLLFSDTPSRATADTGQRRVLEVPISQAAKILGISERTVWRRIDRGELKSKNKGSKRFVKLSVFEPSVSLSSDGHTTMSKVPPNANAVVDLNILLRELQGANYRIGYLESENKQYQEQIKLLPDLQAEAARAITQADQINSLCNELTQIKTSWWYRIFCSWFKA